MGLGSHGPSPWRQEGPFQSECRRGLPATHHDLWEGLQGGLELVGGRQGVWEVHGPGQDEQ